MTEISPGKEASSNCPISSGLMDIWNIGILLSDIGGAYFHEHIIPVHRFFRLEIPRGRIGNVMGKQIVAAEKPVKKAKDKAFDARKEAANKADEAVTRNAEKATQAMGDAAAPATFGVSAAAGRGAAAMQEAGLQARKAGREAVANAEKGMTDNVADKIAQYSKSSGMALISGDLPGIGAKDIVR